MIKTVEWTSEGVRMLDQRLLPNEEKYLMLRSYEEVADAIKKMVVRGAPAIGVSAAMGLALGASQSVGTSVADLEFDFEYMCEVMAATRPTAVNLFWAIERMRCVVEKAKAEKVRDVEELKTRLVNEALAIFQEDIDSNRALGRFGADLIPDGATVLTHCNAGALATAGDYGTALGVIRGAIDAGKRVAVIADETRPFLQGSRLTAWELSKDNIPVTIITDNMAGHVMKQGKVDCVIVGADRIAANGDTANKIGTYMVAVLARQHQIPFYVAAPISTIDFAIASGEEIPIEERDSKEVTHLRDQQLAPEGVDVHNFAFDVTPNDLIAAIITDRGVARSPYTESLAGLDTWDAEDRMRRLWERDASLWTNGDEGKWLGWLSIVDEQQRSIRRFSNFSLEVKDAGFSHVLLLGMGGSSLCPEVMSKSFGKIEGFPELHVLDSTDPAQIKTLEHKIDPANTLFIVSSKSGSTLEPNIFKQYFFERVRQVVGDDEVGNRFIAITDPGSKLRQEAEADHFRKIFLGVLSIGGRYSALSDFGLAPAAAMGVEVAKFLDRTHEMVKVCGADVSARNNPGVILGALLGVAHNQGRDKITIIASPGIHDLGAWFEQLLVESSGKNGKGLVPVDREPPTSPEAYGDDRVFVYLRLDADTGAAQDAAIEVIEDAGQPLVRIAVADVYNLGQEFFRR